MDDDCGVTVVVGGSRCIAGRRIVAAADQVRKRGVVGRDGRSCARCLSLARNPCRYDKHASGMASASIADRESVAPAVRAAHQHAALAIGPDRMAGAEGICRSGGTVTAAT